MRLATGLIAGILNAALEHSQGGATTRSDAHDLGVPMEQRDLVIFTVQVENGGRPD